MSILATPHSIERARRRLGCASDAEAIANLSEPETDTAAADMAEELVRIDMRHAKDPR